MAVEVKCTSEYRGEDPKEPLPVTAELVRWINDLPTGAVLAPITADVGNQRDPWLIMIGLRAGWTEAR